MLDSSARSSAKSKSSIVSKSVHLIPLGWSFVVRRITRVEKYCRHDTSLTYVCLEVQAAAPHAAGEVVVDALNDLDDGQGNPIGSQNAP